MPLALSSVSSTVSTASGPSVLRYDVSTCDLPRVVAEILGVDTLETLRTASLPIPEVGQDQKTALHERFYSCVAPFLPVYRQLIAEYIAPRIGEPFCYQRVPTFRVHLPDSVAVGEFHVDRDYNHQLGEVNFWVPLTRCWGTNSIWIESSPGNRDYHPVVLEPGEILVFDANVLRHGNLTNRTGRTRVSFDFRCIPLRLYVPSAARTVSHGLQLRIGSYFEVFES